MGGKLARRFARCQEKLRACPSSSHLAGSHLACDPVEPPLVAAESGAADELRHEGHPVEGRKEHPCEDELARQARLDVRG